jgi:hypothetical protein
MSPAHAPLNRSPRQHRSHADTGFFMDVAVKVTGSDTWDMRNKTRAQSTTDRIARTSDFFLDSLDRQRSGDTRSAGNKHGKSHSGYRSGGRRRGTARDHPTRRLALRTRSLRLVTGREVIRYRRHGPTRRRRRAQNRECGELQYIPLSLNRSLNLGG